MTSPRLLFPLIVLAALMLAVALVVTTGASLPARPALPRLSWPGWSLPSPGSWPAFNVTVAPSLLVGLVLGWLGRWLYDLPWARVPRAFGVWLLSWRNGARLIMVAGFCVAVILFS
jgi:hypothetical protein